MKALRWYGKEDLRVESVPDPQIEHPRDAIIRITTAGIRGSDLHLYDDLMPSMKEGDILGHEPMGEVVEVGKDVHNLQKGDRVAMAWQEALEHFGYEVPFADIRHQIGKGGDKLLLVFLPPVTLEQQGKQIEEWRSNHFKQKYLSKIRPFPRVRELARESVVPFGRSC